MEWMIFQYIFIGCIVGFVSSFLGVGGGIVMVPTFSIIFKYPQQEAIATSLFVIAMITMFNVSRFQSQRLINWKIAIMIAAFSGLFSYIAGNIAWYLSEIILILIFLLFLTYVIAKTLNMKKNNLTHDDSSILKLAAKIGSLSEFV